MIFPPGLGRKYHRWVIACVSLPGGSNFGAHYPCIMFRVTNLPAFIEAELRPFQKEMHVLEHDQAPCRVADAIRCIHEHVFDPHLNVSFVLDHCQIHSHGFLSLFRFHTGRTLGRYILHLRILAAVRLLGLEEVDITSIAFYLGFNHYRTFSRMMKRHIGYPPSEIRKILLPNNGVGELGSNGKDLPKSDSTLRLQSGLLT